MINMCQLKLFCILISNLTCDLLEGRHKDDVVIHFFFVHDTKQVDSMTCYVSIDSNRS